VTPLEQEDKENAPIEISTKKATALYHFNEGYSNAVRKSLFMKDLLW
jgi:hypothetical protein